MPPTALSDVAHTIQLSVAPVFLLTALGTLLAVLSARLGRIVDRARALSERLRAGAPAERDPIRAEIALLLRRRGRVNTAIVFATSAALLVCVLIGCAFVAAVIGASASSLVAALFIAAMAAFIGALVAFLTEIRLAVSSLRLEMEP
ncbi:MAG TPA: DUF2721 domain-containing protein [Anaeromyxobacteraceae bacterium]|nr:DUF2721 domain-containing protein [Anaeromyxobacteraceae bacterium]